MRVFVCGVIDFFCWFDMLRCEYMCGYEISIYK